MINQSKRSASKGFTLVEILVVLAIIAILAAIIFPAFQRARETSRQANCTSNMQKIAQAVQQYYQDERRYPGSLAVLLPNDARLINYTTSTAIQNTNGTGYLKHSGSFTCLNDPAESTLPRSSYGDISAQWAALSTTPAYGDPMGSPAGDPGRWVWNYWGYTADGTAIPNQAAAEAAPAALRLDPTQPYSMRDRNTIKYSLSNQFAPSTTIITHCVYHRPQTAANIQNPAALYTTPANDVGARDIVLRLDGSAKAVDVSKFKTNNQWIAQDNVAQG